MTASRKRHLKQDPEAELTTPRASVQRVNSADASEILAGAVLCGLRTGFRETKLVRTEKIRNIFVSVNSISLCVYRLPSG